MKTRTGALMVLTLVVAVIMTACSSGGGGGAPATSAPVIAQGVMQKGSVIVNGVTFDDTAAKIAADDSANLPTTFLQDGMVVKVKGKRNDDGLTGTADQVEVENEVRGAITLKGADTITVNGQTVLIDGATVFANGTPTNDFAGLAVGNNVEVHGQRDATGVIHATRVEELAAGAVVDEVRGAISGLSGTGFTIGGLTITTNASTTIVPAVTLANGMVVEVHLSGSTATRVEIEDLEDGEFEHVEGVEFEVEGLISGFTTSSNTFTVGSESVTISSSTRFEGGIKGDLVNDVKVEAEGHSRSGGALLAEKITFKENIRIEAVASSSGSANALGLTVKTTSLTRFEGGLTTAATITAGDGLRIRGFLNRDGSITATRVIKQNPDSNGRSILQGPALQVNATAKSMQIAGITITVATGTPSFNDDSTDSVDDNVPFASLDQFFAAIGSKTMIVKAKGTFASGTLTATEIEIE